MAGTKKGDTRLTGWQAQGKGHKVNTCTMTGAKTVDTRLI